MFFFVKKKNVSGAAKSDHSLGLIGDFSLTTSVKITNFMHRKVVPGGFHLLGPIVGLAIYMYTYVRGDSERC